MRFAVVTFHPVAETAESTATGPVMRTIGHVGSALVPAAVVVSTLDEPSALWFTAILVPASLLPDVDLYLPHVLHQGVVHTYPLMFLVSVTVGLVVAGAATGLSGVRDPDSEKISENPIRAFGLTAGALTLGTFTHLTVDLVAYRETYTSPPVEPLWPFTDWVPRINVFPPNATAWNYGVLVLGVALWAVAFVRVTRRRSRA